MNSQVIPTLPADKVQAIKQLLASQTEKRGMHLVPDSNDLQDAATSLWQAERVIILTGFVIASRGVGETDGPLGSLNLAHACDSLGKSVCIVTDRYSQAALREGLSLFTWKRIPRVISLEKGNEELISYNLLSQFSPDHIVAIERPGQSRDGNYYNMAGNDFSEHVPDSDFLLHLAREQHIPITAVGDGGNEVGMGKIRAYIEEHVPYGATIAADFAADYLIVAGISNWGGSALAALLSLMANRSLVQPEQHEQMLFNTMAKEGLIDGATRQASQSVDALPLDEYLRIHAEIVHLSMPEATVSEE